ncbi:hypothetical protein [Maricaulis sp.]|uniref:hypothetical protein n=1 Tax=Maricaulis sp. TaxID=1486257 RepID=UPI001B1E4CC2|nr:hypothetical protein [Maricaulis sp.]MBO6766665.1 hypothetical protein [Maricaulis sp.]
MPRRTSAAHRRPCRRRRQLDPDLAMSEQLSPREMLDLAEGLDAETSARTALQSAQLALFDGRLRQAERWLGLAGRFVSLGRGLDALAAPRLAAERRAAEDARSDALARLLHPDLNWDEADMLDSLVEASVAGMLPETGPDSD